MPTVIANELVGVPRTTGPANPTTCALHGQTAAGVIRW